MLEKVFYKYNGNTEVKAINLFCAAEAGEMAWFRRSQQ